jgi:hypothetical protein
MAKEALREKEASGFQERGKTAHSELQKESIQSEVVKRCQNQQVTNLEIKEAMARELEEMDLPKYVVDQILHIEDEPPF